MKKTLISIHMFIEFQNTKDIEKILKAEERGGKLYSPTMRMKIASQST